MFYIWINPGWRIKVSGLEKIDKSKSYVIVCNHQSAFDIVLLYRLFTHFKWVAKKELAKVPVIGWNLILNNSILIDRASAVSTKKMISQGLKHLKGGSSVLIFPEGTRTKDGQVKRYLGTIGGVHQQNVALVEMCGQRDADGQRKERQHPQQAYRSCLGILRLGNHYGEGRLEAACRRAFAAGIYSYKGVKNILDAKLDQHQADEPSPIVPPAHENIRGQEYYH